MKDEHCHRFEKLLLTAQVLHIFNSLLILLDIKKLQDTLEKLQVSLNQNGVYQGNTLKDNIQILLDVFQCPVFESIVNVQVI